MVKFIYKIHLHHVIKSGSVDCSWTTTNSKKIFLYIIWNREVNSMDLANIWWKKPLEYATGRLQILDWGFLTSLIRTEAYVYYFLTSK